MADMTTEGQSAGDNFDLTQFYQIFFEEAGENLDQMEQMLLALDLAQADDEELNAIFRCAHSIKGGAATFGFADVAELTHQMESLLDKLRRHELQPSAPMVDVLLESSDALRLLLARHQGRQVDTPATADLVQRISHLANGTAPAPSTAATSAPAAAAATAPRLPRLWQPRRLRCLLARASWNCTSARWKTRRRPTVWPSCFATSRAWARSRPCPATRATSGCIGCSPPPAIPTCSTSSPST